MQNACIERARQLHPNWSIKIWNDDAVVDGARLSRYLDRASSGAQRADLICLDAVLVYGGVYLDSDFRLLKAFDEIIAHYCFFIGTEDGYNLTNGLIGATPQHPAIAAIIDFLHKTSLIGLRRQMRPQARLFSRSFLSGVKTYISFRGKHSIPIIGTKHVRGYTGCRTRSTCGPPRGTKMPRRSPDNNARFVPRNQSVNAHCVRCYRPAFRDFAGQSEQRRAPDRALFGHTHPDVPVQ